MLIRVLAVIREWVILAVRNLCEDNEANQQFMASLQINKVVEIPEELESIGLEAVVENGKLKLSKKKEKEETQT